MNLREVLIEYGGLVVLISHDSAEIWGFSYGLALRVGTLKIMASTGVFVRVVSALKRSISSASQTKSTILTKINHKDSRSNQKNETSKELPQTEREATHTTNLTPIENSGRLDKTKYLDD
jgi:ABC-type sulfate/molybdate transport systems ATPase subunit